MVNDFSQSTPTITIDTLFYFKPYQYSVISNLARRPVRYSRLKFSDQLSRLAFLLPDIRVIVFMLRPTDAVN